MAIVATVKQTEQWLKEVNGGYDILFAPLTVPAGTLPGTVVTVGEEGAEQTVIVAQVNGTVARCMVRGNPSLVDLPMTAAQATALEAVGIVNISQ